MQYLSLTSNIHFGPLVLAINAPKSVSQKVSQHIARVSQQCVSSHIQSEVAMKTKYRLWIHLPVDVAEGGRLCVHGVQPPPEQPARNQDLALPEPPFHQAVPACHSYCKDCSGCVQDMSHVGYKSTSTSYRQTQACVIKQKPVEVHMPSMS
jgi:hypothetical protein